MESTKKSLNRIYKKASYTDEKLPILKVKQENKFKTVEIENMVSSTTRIFNKNDITYLIFDTAKNEKSLYQYINERESLSSDEILKIIHRIGIIIESINNHNYILGSIDLEDFWMIDENLDSLFIRQRKDFLNEDEEYLANVMDNYICSQISSSSVKRRRISNINKFSDVELYGKIFMKLVIPNRSITSYKELRYLAYNLHMFVEGFPVEIYSWINKITDMYNETYTEVKYAVRALEDILTEKERINEDSKSKFKFLYSCISHPGKGKMSKLSEDKVKIIDNINQDSIYLKLKKDCLFAMVADGVSNCTYGTGYKASNIIRKNCEYTFSNGLYFVDKDNICNLYKKIVNESNRKICNNVKSSFSQEELETKNLKDIMASTFVSCFISNNKLFFTSIGDSRILLYRNKSVTPLNIEDNVGNLKLKEGMSWDDYSELERKSSIVKYIGDIDNETKLPKEISVDVKEFTLQKDDILILCSDGITDYLNDLGSKNDVWNINKNIENIINNNLDKDVSYINSRLVQKANYNGGWDNISSIMIKVY